ncbi:MAG: hypothetical protein IJ883_08350 [Eubacterium sp.]|nr:hypothetical protein [Eubacterium sp.]
MFSKRAKAPKPTREDKKDRRIPLSKYARVEEFQVQLDFVTLHLCL